MNAEMMDALQALAVDRGISVETLLNVLVDAMQSAYEKMPGARRDADARSPRRGRPRS